ncbi:TadE family type IV pilus minor pilin [Flindersiella endophytica]
MVTAETAISMTSLVVVLLAMLWVVTLVGWQARCMDAARDAARAMARGESAASSRSEASRSAPPGARIQIDVVGDLAIATVGLQARPPWPILSALPAVSLESRAVVVVEPPTDEEPAPPPRPPAPP